LTGTIAGAVPTARAARGYL